MLGASEGSPIEALLFHADQTDRREDEQYGDGRRADELPEEFQRRDELSPPHDDDDNSSGGATTDLCMHRMGGCSNGSAPTPAICRNEMSRTQPSEGRKAH